jgi:hypothetical protein
VVASSGNWMDNIANELRVSVLFNFDGVVGVVGAVDGVSDANCLGTACKTT